MSELPPGWATTRLDHCSENLDSHRVPVNSSERARRVGDVPYYGATGQVGWIDRPLFNEELVLLGEDGAPFFERHRPKAYLINGPSWVNNHAHVLRGQAVSNRYLMHFLNSIDYHGLANGTTRLKLTQASMNSIAVPVAPLHEQHRIVGAIGEQFSRLDAAAATLERVGLNLRRMRSAVLQSLDTFPDAEVLTLSRLAVDVRTGLDRGRVQQRSGPPGHGYVKMGDVRDGSVDLSNLAYIDASDDEVARYEVVEGDILFNNRNSRELVGKSGLVRSPHPGTLFNNNLVRVRVGDRILPEFLAWQMCAPAIRHQFEGMKSATTNVAAIYTRDLLTLKVMVPSTEVQAIAVARVRAFLGALSNATQALLLTDRRVQALRSSILSAAFSGKLVSQDPSNEPASALVARFLAEPPLSNDDKTMNVRKPRTTRRKVMV